MIKEADVERYLGKPVRVNLSNGKSFDGLYKYWQLDVSDDVPDAMEFYPLNGVDLQGGMVEIAAARIVSVEPLT